MKKLKFRGPLGKRYQNLPACTSVGELVELLRQLPQAMNLEMYGKGVQPVVCNERTDMHLIFEDNDGTWSGR